VTSHRSEIVRRPGATSTAGAKARCLLVLNGTTKVVPSRWSESCAPPGAHKYRRAEAPLFIGY